MLTFEIMGVLALAVLWVNTLLTVGAALTPLGELWARLRQPFRRGEILEATDSEVLATHIVEQVGRRAADDQARQAILFHDRAYRSSVAGGTVALAGEHLPIEPGVPVEVWVSSADKRALAESPAADFDEAYRASRKAKGYLREVTSSLRVGDPVWVAPPSATTPLILVAGFEPRAWLRARLALVLGFQLAMLALSAGVTFLCLYPPVFGTVSIVGAALGLVHFLLVLQPLGVEVRDAVLLPHLAPVRGTWVKPGSEGTGVTAEHPA